jgi:protein-tyrosine phosphatase
MNRARSALLTVFSTPSLILIGQGGGSKEDKRLIDLHTHLLPDWDDGAESWSEMYKMAKIAEKDGIKKIVLTPHIFRLSKYRNDLGVLELRMEQFKEKAEGLPIEFYRGAEVFVHHEMVERIKESNLAVNGSDYVFVEFPADYVLGGVRDLFYRMMLEGFIPIISHPERNLAFAERPELLYELVKMGSLAQVTTKSLTGEFGRETKRVARLFLEHNLVHLIASDAHDEEKRPPVLSAGAKEAAKVVGEKRARAMVTAVPQAILDNRCIHDLGDGVRPS